MSALTNQLSGEIRSGLAKAAAGVDAQIPVFAATEALRTDLSTGIRDAAAGQAINVPVNAVSVTVTEDVARIAREAAVGQEIMVPVDATSFTLTEDVARAVREAEAGQSVDVLIEGHAETLSASTAAAVREAEVGQEINVPVHTTAVTLTEDVRKSILAATVGEEINVPIDATATGLGAQVAAETRAAAVGQHIRIPVSGVVDQAAFKGLAGQVRTGTIVALKGLALGVAGVGVAAAGAVYLAGNFQKQINVLGAVSGTTGPKLAALSRLAIQLGKDVRLPNTSAQDAAEALTELSKAGLSVEDAMAAAKPVLQLSAAAQVDNATAATIAATALNSFHLAGTQAQHVANLLAGTANASAGSIGGMATAIQFAGAAMHSAGQSIDDTAVAIGLMSNAGLSGSVAGSALAAAFRALQAPTEKSQEAMRSLGLNLYDARGQMLPMRDIVVQMSEKFKGLTQEQQNQKLATIFGSRAVQAARIVFLGGADAYDKMAKGAHQANAAQKLAEAQTKGFAGALNALKSNVETVAIQIGLKLLPAATDVAKKLSRVVDLIGEIADAPSFTVGVKIAFNGVESAVSDLKDKVHDLLFGSVESGFKSVDATPAIVRMFKGASQSRAVAAAAAELLNPLNAHRGTPEKIAAPQFETVRTEGLIKRVQDALTGIKWGDIIKRMLTGFATAINAAGDALWGVFSKIFDVLEAHQADIAEFGVKMAVGVISTLLDPIFWVQHWKLAIDVMLLALTAAAPGVGELAKALPLVGRIFKLLEPLGKLLFKFAGRVIRELLGGFAEQFPRLAHFLEHTAGTVFRGFIHRAVDILSELPRAVGRELGGLVREMGSMGRRAVAFLLRQLGRIPELIGNLLTRAGIIARRLLGELGDLMGRLARRGLNKLDDALNGIPRLIGGLLHRAVAKLGDLAGDFKDAAIKLGKQIVSGILDGIKNLAGQLKDKLGSAVGSAMSFLHIPGGSPVDHSSAKWIGTPIVTGVLAGVAPLAVKLGGSLGDAVGKAVRGARQQADQMHDVGTRIKRGVLDGMDGLSGAMGRVWATIHGKSGGAWSGIYSTIHGWVGRVIGSVNNVLSSLHLARIGFAGGGEPPGRAAGGPILAGAADRYGLVQPVPGGVYRVAEAAHPEMVIPLDPARKTRAKELLEVTAKRVGLIPQYADGGEPWSRFAPPHHGRIPSASPWSRFASPHGDRDSGLPRFMLGGRIYETLMKNLRHLGKGHRKLFEDEFSVWRKGERFAIARDSWKKVVGLAHGIPEDEVFVRRGGERFATALDNLHRLVNGHARSGEVLANFGGQPFSVAADSLSRERSRIKNFAAGGQPTAPPVPRFPVGTPGDVGRGASERTRKEIVAWLKAHLPNGKALAEAIRITNLHLPYVLGGGHVANPLAYPQGTGGGFDCSGFVSRVLEVAGAMRGPAVVSGVFSGRGKPGEGALRTYSNSEHVYMGIGDKTFGTSSYNPGGGAGGPLPYGARSGFDVRHYADGGIVPGSGPRLSVTHGGETVIPTRDADTRGTLKRLAAAMTRLVEIEEARERRPDKYPRGVTIEHMEVTPPPQKTMAEWLGAAARQAGV